jgi:hypothetical protein
VSRFYRISFEDGSVDVEPLASTRLPCAVPWVYVRLIAVSLPKIQLHLIGIVHGRNVAVLGAPQQIAFLMTGNHSRTIPAPLISVPQ